MSAWYRAIPGNTRAPPTVQEEDPRPPRSWFQRPWPEANRSRTGASIQVAGLVIRPHQPPTRSGRRVVFFTLADESGLLGVTVWPDVYRCDGAALFHGAVVAEGRIHRKRGLTLVAEKILPIGEVEQGPRPSRRGRQMDRRGTPQ